MEELTIQKYSYIFKYNVYVGHIDSQKVDDYIKSYKHTYNDAKHFGDVFTTFLPTLDVNKPLLEITKI